MSDIWQLHNFGDATSGDGPEGYGIICRPLFDADADFGMHIYLRADDPLGHAREIIAALNEYEARKAATTPEVR